MEIDVSGQSRADVNRLNWPLLRACLQRGLSCCCGGLLGGAGRVFICKGDRWSGGSGGGGVSGGGGLPVACLRK